MCLNQTSINLNLLQHSNCTQTVVLLNQMPRKSTLRLSKSSFNQWKIKCKINSYPCLLEWRWLIVKFFAPCREPLYSQLIGPQSIIWLKIWPSGNSLWRTLGWIQYLSTLSPTPSQPLAGGFPNQLLEELWMNIKCSSTQFFFLSLNFPEDTAMTVLEEKTEPAGNVQSFVFTCKQLFRMTFLVPQEEY